jgi:hypothetical protein
MRRTFRNIIFFGFATTFIIVAPLLVLYTAGYRYNSLNGHIVHTGVLSASSMPRGATISVPSYSIDKKTPYIFNRVMPGEYLVTFNKEGYHSWQQKLTVSSGHTAYATDILLFRDALPTLLESLQLNQMSLTPNKHNTTGVPSNSPIILVINNQAVEIHDATADGQPLIGLLPSANYQLGDVRGHVSIVLSDNGMIYAIDTKASNPIVLAEHGTIYDFDTTNNLLAWSDGVEIHTFDLSSKTATFITRQSNAIISLAWQATGKALLASTNDDVLAFSLDSWKTVTTLLSDATIFSFWLNEARDTGYFYGDYNGATGLFMLPVTK